MSDVARDPESLPLREITDPVQITVNGDALTVQDGELLIEACERNGAYIPRFCYHPRMTSVGMCRMCLVEVDTGRGPSLQPSCMLPVTADMVVDTEKASVAKAQDGILEFLLANHPLDCPVCDKGGECPLQDQAYAFGPGESRFVEEKRHLEKPIAISETVYLDRERCILCDRCTRFADEVAGDPLIHFLNRGASTEVNTFPGEPFASYFSGNTVQICPVGALTATPYRFKARPWDLEIEESTCTRCSVGCRITIESTRNKVVRLQGVDSDPVNWSWLCDKGRFGFEAMNSPDRLLEPMIRGVDGELGSTRWSSALEATASAIRTARARSGPESIAVLGGARLTNESAYAWAKLAKSVIGTDNVDAQIGDGLGTDVVLGLRGASIDDVCTPGATVLYLGPDPREVLPVLFLRLKHAAQRDGVRLVELSPSSTSLSKFAAHHVECMPGDAPALLRDLLADAESEAGSTLRAAENLFVVIGRANLAESAAVVSEAAQVIAAAVPTARFLSAISRGNVRGALEAGMAPGILPGRRALDDQDSPWSSIPTEVGLDAAGILEAGAAGRIEVLILLGADPLVDFPDRELARRALAGVNTIISVDPFLNASSQDAQVVLPTTMFGEVAGTTTNLEGRVSVVQQKVTPPGTVRPEWMLAAEIADRLGADLGVTESAQELWEEFRNISPAHAELSMAALRSPAGADGLLADGTPGSLPLAEPVDVPATNAYSLRLVVDRAMYDNGTLLAHSPASATLASESAVRIAPVDADRLGVVSGTLVKIASPNGSLTVAALVDECVMRGTAALSHNLEGADSGALVSHADPVCDLRVEVP